MHHNRWISGGIYSLLWLGILGTTVQANALGSGPMASNPERFSPSTLLAQVPQNDLRIIPGVRVGPVTAKMTRADLVRLFGGSKLQDRTILGPEGIGSFAATRVNLGPEKSFLVVWKDSRRRQMLDIRDLGPAWKTPEGIGIGMGLDQLRQVLGEFQFLGFGWDYGGGVLLEQTRLGKRYSGKLILRLDVNYQKAQKYEQDYRAVSGDQTVSSDNPQLKNLEVRVSQMYVIFDRAAL
ncbi:hypothetical protein BST81_20065 [Leptolyngbya sp. 'hensonii']|uniref:hypothetical protein n=1 Tax=Leptolyngbya sp. 'hensonii' TaxID=1922337 RepID=UPI00094FF91B|nr:hypothetical protein [Leptolyngbya sp. 'hensonii']OLP16731.1 hypothetical protein BST81_20065 [Leptolyngbya sp. 'hensonii']